MLTPLQAARFLNVMQEPSLTAIQRRFREMAIRYHPDKNRDPGAKKKFVQYREAWEVIEAYVKDGGKLPIEADDGHVEQQATRNPSDQSREAVTSAYAPMTFEELIAALSRDHSIVTVVGGHGARVANVRARATRNPSQASDGALSRKQDRDRYAIQDPSARPIGQILVYGSGISAAVRRALARGAGSVALPTNTCLKEADGTCTFGATTARIEGGIAWVGSRPYHLVVLPDGGSR